MCQMATLERQDGQDADLLLLPNWTFHSCQATARIEWVDQPWIFMQPAHIIWAAVSVKNRKRKLSTIFSLSVHRQDPKSCPSLLTSRKLSRRSSNKKNFFYLFSSRRRRENCTLKVKKKFQNGIFRGVITLILLLPSFAKAGGEPTEKLGEI